MQIEIVKHGAIRTFRKRVVNHMACRLTNLDLWGRLKKSGIQVMMRPVAYRYTFCVTPGNPILTR